MARKRMIPGSSGYTILVIDDQQEILLTNRLLLEGQGHQVLTAGNGEEALLLFRSCQVDLVIVDCYMPDMNGEVVVHAVRTMEQNVPILLQTGYSGEKPVWEMFRFLDVQGYHDKLEGPEQLLLWVDALLGDATRHEGNLRIDQRTSQRLVPIWHSNPANRPFTPQAADL